MVLGHERCSAIKAGIEALKHGGEHRRCRGEPAVVPSAISYLVRNLKPAIDKAYALGKGDLAENAMRANVLLTVQRLKKSQVPTAPEKSGRLKIVGARYDRDSEAVAMLFD